jgi:hypothetical protein
VVAGTPFSTVDKSEGLAVEDKSMAGMSVFEKATADFAKVSATSESPCAAQCARRYDLGLSLPGILGAPSDARRFRFAASVISN